MDFNKAFSAYESMTGTLSQTAGFGVTQQEAALQAVKNIGLNQISEVKPEWFYDTSIWDMEQDECVIYRKNKGKLKWQLIKSVTIYIGAIRLFGAK